MINFMFVNPKSCGRMEDAAKAPPEKKETTSSCQFDASSFNNNARELLKTENPSSTDLCPASHNFNLPEGIFQKFCNGLSSRLFRKPPDYKGRGDAKHILINSLDSPIYYDASRFLKKQINKIYPLSRKSGHDCRELEVFPEGDENQAVEELQILPYQPRSINAKNQFQSLTTDQIRAKVISELMNSERDYVKILKNVTEAYLFECRKCTRLFTTDDIRNIFGNWEQIYKLQIKFFQSLENKFNEESPHQTCVGDCFLAFKDEFTVYSDYCNNHPLAMTTVQQLCENEEYKAFFESVCSKYQLAAISLNGYLLTPIQRICKYPLQLAELLKYTKANHPDHKFVTEALKTMREVTISVNERKRRMESLEKLILWQQEVEGWEGSNLVEQSSLLIYENDVSRVFTGLWFTNVTVFLFDHQVILCKKYQDHFKNEFLVYKGRVSLTYCEIIDIPEGKDTLLGISVRYGIKIQNMVENKWLILCCRNQTEKHEWLESFRNERELVLRDKRNRLEITAEDRYLANMIAATCDYDRVWSNYEGETYKVTENLLLAAKTGSCYLDRKPRGGSQIYLQESAEFSYPFFERQIKQ